MKKLPYNMSMDGMSVFRDHPEILRGKNRILVAVKK